MRLRSLSHWQHGALALKHQSFLRCFSAVLAVHLQHFLATSGAFFTQFFSAFKALLRPCGSTAQSVQWGPRYCAICPSLSAIFTQQVDQRVPGAGGRGNRLLRRNTPQWRGRQQVGLEQRGCMSGVGTRSSPAALVPENTCVPSPVRRLKFALGQHLPCLYVAPACLRRVKLRLESPQNASTPNLPSQAASFSRQVSLSQLLECKKNVTILLPCPAS